MNADEITCPECAETIKAAAKVCKHCGYRLDKADTPLEKGEAQPPSQLDIFHCPKCHKPTPEKRDRCRHCKAKFGEAASATGETANWSNRTFDGDPKPLFAGCGVVVLVVGGLLLSQCGDAKPEQDEVTESAASETPQPMTGGADEVEIVTLCDLTVKRALATEPDMDFGWRYVPRGDNEMRVVRGFKAQNAFGTNLKYNYYCTYNSAQKRITKLEVEGPGGSQRII